MKDWEIVPALDLARFIQYYRFYWDNAQEDANARMREHAQSAKNYFATEQLPACFDERIFECIRSNETGFHVDTV